MVCAEYKGIHLYGWLKQIKSVVPPLCVEIFLKDNRSYFLNSVCYWDDQDPIAVMRIWDLREISEDDILDLKRAMDEVRTRDQYTRPDDVHKKLDWANLRIPKDFISYAIEWHDRLWKRGELGFNKRVPERNV